MERLTMRTDDGRVQMNCYECKELHRIPGGCSLLACTRMVVERLAAYEDTGLIPEQIKELIKGAGPE